MAIGDALGAGLAWPSVGLVPCLWMAMVRLDWLGRPTVYARRQPIAWMGA